MNLLGNYEAMAEALVDSREYPFSFLEDKWDNVKNWQELVRSKVFELLSYNPPSVPLNPKTLNKFEYDGVQTELVSYDQPFGPPTEAYFLKPILPQGSEKEKLPVVIALHDHSGIKFYGKEKVTALPDEDKFLVEFKKRSYGGASWASRLAKCGFAVLAIDIFLWGSRRMDLKGVNRDFTKVLDRIKYGSKKYIEMYNHFCGQHETMVAKSLFTAGTTWPGIMVWEDKRAVDYLLTRDDIDPERIGCGGLSGGGEQTIFLAGLDSRIKCSVCVCFMNTWAQMVRHNISGHSWMVYVPLLSNFIDMPDILTLSGGKPAMVQYRENDPLFAYEGQKACHEKIDKVYNKMGCKDNYEGRFYPGDHEFSIAMQDDAFAWFKRWL